MGKTPGVMLLRKGTFSIFVILSTVLSASILSTGELRTSDTPLPPACVIAVSEQDGCVPLYWFKTGSQSWELAYDDGTKDHQFYVSDRWLNNKAAVRMTSSALPFALLESKVLISYQGAEDDTLYDYKTPFLISVNKDSSGFPGQALWGPAPANATGLDSTTEEGEWVEITHDLVFAEDSLFWIVFHWKEDSPTAPLIGEDDSTNSGRSFYFWLNDYGYFEWKSWPGYNLMIRSVIVTQDSTDTLSSPDGFKIYRSREEDFSLSTENLKDSVGSDQFGYIDYDLENGRTYYYKLTSVYTEEDSDPSNEVEAVPKRAANLGVSKTLIEVSLDTNQSALEYLDLSNAGGIPLDFEMKMNLSVDDSSGGTDHFGYSWTDNRKKQGLAFNWIDIADYGVLLNRGGGAEYVFGPIPLQFSFPFYGAEHDSLWVTLNGCLCFRQVGLLKWVNDTLPDPQTPLNLIAPFWSNLWFDEKTKIYHYSTSDSLIASFIDIKHFISGKYFSFQAILTARGTIDFQYKKVEDPLVSATIGMQNEDGTCGLLISYNQDYSKDSLRIRIAPGWIEVEPKKGKILPEENLPVSLFLKSDFLEVGNYSGSLNINSRDKNRHIEPVDISLILNVVTFEDTLSDTTGTDTTGVDTTETDTTTAVFETEDVTVITFLLQQNYPNPFNTTTIIPYAVHGKRKTENNPIPISLKIYNIQGALVRVLIDEKKTRGEYEAIWDGKSEKGEAVASGIYFYRLKAGDFSETKKMILLR